MSSSNSHQTPTPQQCEEAATAALEAIRDIMDAEGIGGRYLAKKLKSELNARMTQVFKGKALKKAPDGTIMEVDELIYSKRMVAHDIRIKALDMAFKLRGDYTPEKHELTGKDGGSIPIEHRISETLEKRLDKYEGIYERLALTGKAPGDHEGDDPPESVHPS
jgi:hypothetical protein